MNWWRGLVVDIGTILFWLLVVPAFFTVLVVALVPYAAASVLLRSLPYAGVARRFRRSR